MFFSVSLSAQLPTEYGQEDRQFIERYVENLRQDFDLVIDPIERMPTQPTAYALASGNWGADYLGINTFYGDIYERAQRKVVVFVFDTAPFFDHPFLLNSAWNEKSKSYTNEETLVDGQGHGHHVAGIVSAQADTYTIGIAHALADKSLIKLIPREVLNDNGSGMFSWIAQALEEANDEVIDLQRQGYFVIYNLSLGGSTGKHKATDDALKEARDLGVFVCAASGNTYEQGVQFPGNSTGSHAIGSIDQDSRRSSFSSYGPELFVGAPGRSILSTYKNGSVATLSGTSMATPTEAGIVAITASIYPELSAQQIEKLLIETATDIDPEGRDDETGYGYNFIAQILSEQPDEEEPVTREQRKSKQTMRAVFEGPYEAIYQAEAGLFKTIYLRDIEIDFRSKMYAEQALDDLNDKIESFFESRAMTLTDKADALSAGHWAGRFLEIYLKKEHDISSDFINAVIEDEKGHRGRPSVPGLFDYFHASRRTTFKY